MSENNIIDNPPVDTKDENEVESVPIIPQNEETNIKESDVDTTPTEKDEVTIIEPKQEEKSKEYKGFTHDAYYKSNIVSKTFFYWALYILCLARKTKLTPSHLGPLSEENSAASFSDNIKYFWHDKNYKSIKSNALMKTMFRANICRLVSVFLLSLIYSGFEYITVLLLKEMIDYFNQETHKYPFMYYGIAFLTLELISIFLSSHLQMKQSVFGNRAGFELNCFIYNKILTASSSTFSQRATQGEIVNFLQVDSNKLNWMIQISPSIAISPLMIGAYIYLLFDFFGLSFFAGIGVMSICVIINYFIFKKYTTLEEAMLKKKDGRMRVTTEAFDNIKMIKLYNWEDEFKRKIYEAREAEIDVGWNAMKNTTWNISVFWFCPVAVAIATIGVYQYYHAKFDIGTMLIGLAIFARLQDPVRDLPVAINSVVETFISMNRIEKYIRQPDRNEDVIKRGEYDPNGEFAIKIEHGTFTWGEKQKKKDDDEDKKEEDDKDKKKDKKKVKDKDEELIKDVKEPLIIDEAQKPKKGEEKEKNYDIVLKDISFIVKPGELVGIIGEVGSGKSSLFQAILNGLIILNPEQCDGIHINGQIGFVSQTPWIQNATIRDNILCFNEYNKEKYQRILVESQLLYDLKTLEGGDMTEIGEKGINLSGGQKVRVTLARALYSEPDIFLFDDPISALDANIGNKIMKECIVKSLKGKTRIVATHALQYLKYMDRIIYLNNGTIEWSGSYHELLDQPFFDSLSNPSKLSSKKMSSDSGNGDIVNTDKAKESESENKGTRIIRDEDEEIGVVKFDVYKGYAKYMGGICFLFMITIIMMLWQVNKGGSDLWLAYWSEPENQDDSKKLVFFIIYSSLGLASTIFIFFRIFLLGKGTIRLSRLLHNDMIDALIKAPINLFHETIPRGQIYNRLSKDLETLQYAFFTFGSFLVSLFTVFGALVICSVYDLYSLIFIPFIGIIGYLLTVFYLIGSRQLSRLESISHSPILNTINETIPGTDSIYASNKRENYLNKFYNNINNSFVIQLFFSGTQNWFCMQFSFISFLYMSYLVLLTIFKADSMSSQSIGIMFTYSVLMERSMGWLFLQCSDMEISMVSMERCMNYTKIKSEINYDLPSDEDLKKEQWPAHGAIRFENYSVKYRPNTEIVLKNISFSIKPNERVGVVGRTGSGKSTICLCLFRILEPLEGTIYIDDKDICNVGLDLLRKKITIIPQDPCLMEGTLRYNIDPFAHNEDKEILQVLKDIGFEGNENDKDLLDKQIEQNGKNLSVGEKQLVCIARAILRKTKIIVMDEATANIDIKTEEKIQKALVNFLQDSTILTIAHRIKTIIHYDKILVLDNGTVAEFDTPEALLKNESSLFYQLYSKSVV